ncbi:hypothetical protein PEPS_37680 (plasmid) [Persicobacter psychrovividus]|uniref:Uncharacterized protein n=1 Tax=Persicobacter psychrovividus TaxID=387638 RepID=A0ABN6LE63_9BACT|nr:hypothetical protein PEPS_37680 [Persicobacter psychrovividus]
MRVKGRYANYTKRIASYNNLIHLDKKIIFILKLIDK